MVFDCGGNSDLIAAGLFVLSVSILLGVRGLGVYYGRRRKKK